MSEHHVKDMLMEHFMNPRNVGELADADGVGDVGNPLCGDMVRLYLKIQGNRIQKATFKTFGCRAAIATSSILTEIAKGKTVDEALQLKKEDIAKILGDLPPLKQHCAKLAELALKAAIGDYFEKTRSDKTLSDKVAELIRDPQQWTPASASDGLEEIAQPL